MLQILLIILSCSSQKSNSNNITESGNKALKIIDRTTERAINSKFNISVTVKEDDPIRKALLESSLKKVLDPASIVIGEQQFIVKLLNSDNVVEFDGNFYTVDKQELPLSTIYTIPQMNNKIIKLDKVGENEFGISISVENVIPFLHENAAPIFVNIEAKMGWIHEIVPEEELSNILKSIQVLMGNNELIDQFQPVGDSKFNILTKNGSNNIAVEAVVSVDNTIKQILPALLKSVTEHLPGYSTTNPPYDESMYKKITSSTILLNLADTTLTNTKIFGNNSLELKAALMGPVINFVHTVDEGIPGFINISILFIDDRKAIVYYSLSPSYDNLSLQNGLSIDDLASFKVIHSNGYITDTERDSEHSEGSMLMIEGEFEIER